MLHLLKNTPRSREKPLACLCEAHPTPGPNKKALPQLELEVSDLSAERRLCDREERGSAVITAELCDVHEVFELFEVHPVLRAVSHSDTAYLLEQKANCRE